MQIRDEVRRARQELQGELHQTNERLDHLERRQTEDAMRLTSELVAVANAVGQVRDLLKEQRADHNKLDDHPARDSRKSSRDSAGRRQAPEIARGGSGTKLANRIPDHDGRRRSISWRTVAPTR